MIDYKVIFKWTLIVGICGFLLYWGLRILTAVALVGGLT